ncbi:tyrosine--tRNA ligase [bacterium]|nr:tyrosine--tRNA ligase [bacterium]
MTIEEQVKLLKKGVEEIVPEGQLIAKLKKSAKTGKPLRIKYGIDPTGSQVHIGHLVPIRKMRQFQDLGHIGVIIIGDFTAQIGDPTGKNETRPTLTKEQIMINCEKYMDQLYTVLDKDKTEVRFQTEWFGSMTMADVIKLMGKFTLAQFMAHDTFRKRYESGLPLGMHEIMYPILQGYDSVAIESDIELGATEQKFNLLAGRDMQRYHNQEEQVAIMSPILMGTDGVNKMGKSLNNYIAVFDTPKDKYGKVMSIPDNLIINYFTYATNLSDEEISAVQMRLEAGENPKNLKQLLARELVKIYHGQEIAQAEEDAFNSVFAKGNIPDDIEEFSFAEDKIWVIKLLTDTKLCQTNGEAKRMLKQNAVSIDGEKVTDPDLEIELISEIVVKVGKRRFAKIIKK